jgi:hypothetical protein
MCSCVPVTFEVNVPIQIPLIDCVAGAAEGELLLPPPPPHAGMMTPNNSKSENTPLFLKSSPFVKRYLQV